MTFTIDSSPAIAFGLQCVLCKHRSLHYGGGCAAFPQGIPAAIARDEFDHSAPYPGDNGIRFELIVPADLEPEREEAVASA